ncbi:MAG: hypothetical protein HYZ54_13955 [Ignavibacteriae bacterium]|nr:hypothetical protein [Ignavibacteriota bacterium]
MGRPLAVVRASRDLAVQGEPASRESWPDLKYQVDQYDDGTYIAGNDYQFTKVDFPVKIGNISQTEDGLIGYFKDEDYGTFYAPAVKNATDKVLPPGPNNLLVNCSEDQGSLEISMLIEPRGKIHASTGILPVKSIEIPPDQYLDALQKLQLCFLTSPILTSKSGLSLPLPSQTGGIWSWVENEGSAWSSKQQILPVTVDAVMNYGSQQLLEGWLNLANMILTGISFSILNNKAGKAVLYITNDANLNALTFKYTNKTGVPLQLLGGHPVSGSYIEGGSSFVFNFEEIFPDQILAGLTVNADGWSSKYFPIDEDSPAVWAVAPLNNMTLAANESISFSITGITVPAGSQSGNFQVAYFAFPDIPDSIAPVLLAINVQLPTSK